MIRRAEMLKKLTASQEWQKMLPGLLREILLWTALIIITVATKLFWPRVIPFDLFQLWLPHGSPADLVKGGLLLLLLGSIIFGLCNSIYYKKLKTNVNLLQELLINV